MAKLSEIYQNLQAISGGDLATFSRTTTEFARDVANAARPSTPPQPAPADAGRTEPAGAR